MLATAKNFDVICFQLRTTYYSQLNNPLKKDLDAFLAGVKAVVTSGKKIKPGLTSMLGQTFNLRVKAIKWLLADGEDNLLNMIDDIVPQIEDLKANPKLEILSENILFALRCNKRVVKVIIDRANEEDQNLGASLSQLPEINYQQFIASMTLGIPDSETATKNIKWINASLCIEFVIVAAGLIYSDKLKVSDKAINELSFLVADAAQEYSAIATELGILKSNSQNQSSDSVFFDKELMKEQKILANLGLDDFAENFD